MDRQVAEVKIPHRSSTGAQAKRCSRCGSPVPLGAYHSEGTPPAHGPSLCLQCAELRSELEALSEEYRSCLTRLRQCRDELNHFQSKQAKVGGVPHPVPVRLLDQGCRSAGGKFPRVFVQCGKTNDMFISDGMRSFSPR